MEGGKVLNIVVVVVAIGDDLVAIVIARAKTVIVLVAGRDAEEAVAPMGAAEMG